MHNIVDHLSFWASLKPDAIALKSPHGQFSFSELQDRVKRIAHKLRTLGIRKDQLAITAIADKYIDWIITLALMHEAASTCAERNPLSIQTLPYDWLIIDRNTKITPNEKTICIDTEWLIDAAQFSRDIEQRHYDSAESTIRIMFTSGTTGTPRAASLNLTQVTERARCSLQNTNGSRVTLSLFPLTTALGFNNAVANLINGTTLYCGRGTPELAQLLAANRGEIDGLHGSPMQIASLLDALPSQGGKMTSLHAVIYAGGSAPASLLERIFERLSANVYNDYGSTETAGIWTRKIDTPEAEQHGGVLYPDAEAEIVDERGRPVPIGQEGSIRVRRPHMIQGYFAHPEDTIESFHEGWFYPGDRGRLSGNRFLVLTGRDSELINLGGVKLNPVSVDMYLLNLQDIKDAACFFLTNHAGVPAVAAAVVTAGSVDIERLRNELIDHFGPTAAPSVIFEVEEIPRNQMGKAMRSELSQLFGSLPRPDATLH